MSAKTRRSIDKIEQTTEIEIRTSEKVPDGEIQIVDPATGFVVQVYSVGEVRRMKGIELPT